jgi:putative spermidine/putrescine transport system ATP-binding protein
LSAIVRFQNISKSYDGRSHAVRDINLTVMRGEFLTLLGPSGSGKTTSLMMLAGFETPTTGEIFLEERLVSTQPPHKRDIGMVFQNYALFPHMTVGENIAFPLQIRGEDRSAIARRVEEALDLVRLPGVAERRPIELSGGQQQRVALARALVYQPRIVLMDEPLGALDRQLREGMQIEIKALHARLGVTIVYVTHDQGEALTMSDRIAIFNGGRIEQIADPRALYEEPCNAFVASFVGDNNLLTGDISGRHEGEVRFVSPGTGSILARAGDVGEAGPGVVAIRPEKIRLAPSAPAGDREAVVSGVVETVIYFGDCVKIMLRLPGGQTLSVKADTEFAVRQGDALRVTWRRDDAVVHRLPG